MKLTIIPSDNTVYVDGTSYELDLSSCNIPNDVHALQWNNNIGEIEKQSINEEINSLPTWANDCYLLWQTKNNEENATKEPTLEENQKKASSLLFESDWVENPSVVDTNNTPHLLNKTEFDNYRIALRVIAVTPQSGNITFPTKPIAQWSN